jgi:type I restriction enzyme S subunit
VKAEGRKTNGDWKTVTLGGVFDIARGGSPRPIDKFLTDDPDGVNWIMISDATSKYITSTKKRIIKEGMKKSREVSPGDFLLTNSMSFGRPYIMQTSGCIHDGWLVLSPRGGVAHPDYFYHLLGSDILYAEFERRAAGATVKNLNIDLVKGVEVLLPPLAEQRRIAEVLDRAEALRAKRRAALAQLDTLTQSLFLDLFGDPLAKNGKGAHVPFESVTRRITYGFTCPMKHLDSGIPILTAKNVRDGFIDFDKVHYADKAEFDALTAKSKPVRGDLLITKDGTIGRCAVVESDEPLCINQSVALVLPDHSKVLPSYMVAYLLTDRVQQVMKNMGKGNALAHLQITELAELPMPLPTIEQQREFARQVSAVEKLKAAQRASLAELDALFATLQHRAFRGEL